MDPATLQALQQQLMQQQWMAQAAAAAHAAAAAQQQAQMASLVQQQQASAAVHHQQPGSMGEPDEEEEEEEEEDEDEAIAGGAWLLGQGHAAPAHPTVRAPRALAPPAGDQAEHPGGQSALHVALNIKPPVSFPAEWSQPLIGYSHGVSTLCTLLTIPASLWERRAARAAAENLAAHLTPLLATFLCRCGRLRLHA